tara:strand:+ start:645 stop:1049 length:405 start_codon:yes stop_codon:yes gene_type:complete
VVNHLKAILAVMEIMDLTIIPLVEVVVVIAALVMTLALTMVEMEVMVQEFLQLFMILVDGLVPLDLPETGMFLVVEVADMMDVEEDHMDLVDLVVVVTLEPMVLTEPPTLVAAEVDLEQDTVQSEVVMEVPALL